MTRPDASPSRTPSEQRATGSTPTTTPGPEANADTGELRPPQGLSGQEREALQTLERGYDNDGGALPDPDGVPEPDHPVSPAHARPGPAAPDAGGGNPLKQAQRDGLIPDQGTVAPPLDSPEDDDAGVSRP